MDTKQKLFVFLLIFASFSASKAFADDSTTTATSTLPTIATTTAALLTATTTTGSVLGLTTPSVPPIIAAINSAKAQLAGVSLNHQLLPVYKKNTKKLLRYNLGDKDIALAILDPSTNNTIITMGRLSGKSMVFPDPAVNVKLTSFNGVNSKFQVNMPAGGIVVALKYLISGTASGSKAAIEKGLSQVVYVPSSPALGSPDVIAYGQTYLDSVIAKVVKDLYGLPSQAVAGETITEAIPPAMIKSLIYAEHTDTGQVLNGNAQDALNSLNIIFATNQGDAYKYSVSNDGYSSRGIAQFLSGTYLGLVQRHPEAFLNPDYIAGMQDHENSIKAMYLLLDDDAGAVRAEAPNNFVASRAFEYGAASYNAGSARVVKAVKTFGDNWNQDRSGQVNALQAQVSSFTSQVKSLKAQIKKASAKIKSSLQSQLATAQANLSSASTQLSQIKTGTLTNTTINYLSKIYKVVPFFNQQQLAMNQ